MSHGGSILRTPLEIPVFNVTYHHSPNEDNPTPQTGFFDLDERYAKLNERDPLVKLNPIIDWEAFREPLSVLRNKPRRLRVLVVELPYHINIFDGVIAAIESQ